LGIAAFLIIVGFTPVLAQEDSSTSQPDWFTGGSIGLAGSRAHVVPLELFTVNFHASRARPGRAGIDFAAGTLPRFILEGVLPFGARLGGTVRLDQSPDVTLWPSAGISVAGFAGGRELGGLTGGYAGVAIARFPDDDDTGFRLDWTLHQFEGGWIWLMEVGFVTRH